MPARTIWDQKVPEGLNPGHAELILGNVYASVGRRRGDEGSGYKLL